MSTGTDSAAKVSIDQTLFASEIRYHTAGLPLVSITWDDLGRVRVVLPDGVWIRVEADWIVAAGAAAPARLAGQLRQAWEAHLERAGSMS